MDGFENRDRNSFQTHEDPSGEDRSFENDQSHYRYKVNPVSQPYEDSYDDLKTSSFYNEGYKKPGKGKLKGLLVPLLIVALISSMITGGLVASYFTFVSPSINQPEARNGSSGDNIVPENTDVKRVEIVNNSPKLPWLQL